MKKLSLDIIYDEKNPQEVVINNFLDKWFNLGIALISGILAFFVHFNIDLL